MAVAQFAPPRVVLEYAVEIGCGNYHSGNISLLQLLLQVGYVGATVALRYLIHRHTMVAGVCVHHLAGGGIEGSRHQYAVAFAAVGNGHKHCFSSGCRAVIHRCVAHLHTRKGAHHALVFKYILERTLRYLGLVGGVGGQEFRSGYYRLHHRWGVVVIVAGSGEACELSVLGAEGVEEIAHLFFAVFLRQFIVAVHYQLVGHVAVQVRHLSHAATLQHGVYVSLGMGKISMAHIRAC